MYEVTQPTPEQRAAAELAQREQRARDLVKSAAPADGAGDESTLSFEEFRALCEAPDIQQKIAEIDAAVQQRMEQAATALAAPLVQGPAASRDGRPNGPGAPHHVRPTQTPPQPSSPRLRP